MTCTTFLHDGELNQPLPDKECQLILDEARKNTGKGWQVVPIYVTSRKWFKKRTETLYGVYVYVGGVGPWQQINFYHAGSGSTINLYVPLSVVAAYLLGMLAVPTEAAHGITEKGGAA
jgi:hypothetical protein